MTKAIFLQESLFTDSSSSQSESSFALFSYFFDEYFTVLRKEICLAASDRVENKIIRSENAEFLLAVYQLHQKSSPKSGATAYTPSVLLNHLNLFITEFRLDNTKYSDINISSTVLLNCVRSLSDMIDLINNNPTLHHTSMNKIIKESTEWKSAYTALQESFEQAFLQIRSLLDVNAVNRNADKFHEIKDYIQTAKTMSSAWKMKVIELKHKLNKYPVVCDQDKLLYNKLMNCQHNIQRIDQFIKSPVFYVSSEKDDTKPDILSYFEFQANLKLKIQFMLKGMAPKKDLSFYQSMFYKIANKYIDPVTNEAIPSKRLNEEKFCLESRPKPSNSLEELNAEFDLYYTAINEMIDQLALSKSKPNIHQDNIYATNAEEKNYHPQMNRESTSFDPAQLQQLECIASDDVADVIITSNKNDNFINHKRNLSFFAISNLEAFEENNETERTIPQSIAENTETIANTGRI